jgi:hypothetical protein
MSFKNGGFTCFACGVKGDVIKLIGHMLNTKPLETAKILDRDYSLNLNIGGTVDHAAVERHKLDRAKLAAFNEWFRKAGNVWASYCRMLRAWQRDYAPRSPEDTPDPRYIESLRLDYAEFVHEEIFIKGLNDFKKQVKFYESHRKEVTAIGERIREIGFTG